MQFLRKMWPIQLAFCFLTSCGIFLCTLTVSNTSSFLTCSVQLISILVENECLWQSQHNYIRPLIEWAIIRLNTRKITEKIIQCNMWHTSRLGWGREGKRYVVFTMLWGVRLCRGDVDAYARFPPSPLPNMMYVTYCIVWFTLLFFLCSTWWWPTQLGAKTCSCFQGFPKYSCVTTVINTHFLPA
jgi:hypothetical protein